jgi:hypothetical protein
MRKLILLSIVLLFSLALAMPAMAQSTDGATTIVGSAHDLTSGGAGADLNSTTDRVCVFCHTPHDNATTTSPPLWNHGPISAGNLALFTMYDSPTIDMTQTVAGEPSGISLACLSCHDGNTGMDSLLQPPTGFVADNTAMLDTNGNLLGVDLRGEHPISLTYDDTADTAFNDPPLNNVILFGALEDQVECSSCHNVHVPGDSTAGTFPFLRESTDASLLCVSCHIK